MLARIINNKEIKIEQITIPEEDIIYNKFSIKLPGSQYIDTSMGFFDGYIRKYNKYNQKIARPLLPMLKNICNKHGLPLDIIDERSDAKFTPSIDDVKPDLLNGITLYDHQVRAIKSTIGNEYGMINIPTGGGKTEIMVGIAKIMNCKTVILCDVSKTIVEQIAKRLELYDITEDVGVFFAGKRPNGQEIIVGSFQSLIVPKTPKRKDGESAESYAKKCKGHRSRKKNAKKLKDMIKECDLLLVDECDTSCGPSWRKFFKNTYNGRRKYGLSGTCNDPAKPVENFTLKEHYGEIICNVDRKELEDIGAIVPVTYKSIAVGDSKFIKDKSAFDIAQKECMINNKTFHRIIKSLCERSINDDKHGVLILVESKDLGYALNKMIDNSEFICGDTKMTNRREITKKFENREINVLIGGKIVRRGFDLSGGCETLIIATGGKLISEFDQRVGRAVRKNKNGRSTVYDFFFLNNHYLYAHSRNRLKGIVELGYDAKVIFPGHVIEAKKFIKSRFRRPKGC